jgi:hypothetical protein
VNYTELVAAIKGYCENDFPTTAGSFTSTDQVNTFIKQAEQRIYNSVQFPAIRKNVTAATTINNKYLSSPADFLATYSLAVIDDTGSYEYLLNKDVNFIRQSFPSPTDTGKPQYYAIFGPTTTNDTPPVITNEYSFILGQHQTLHTALNFITITTLSLLLLHRQLGLQITLVASCCTVRS